MKLIFESWRRFLNEQKLNPSKTFWGTGEVYHPGTKTIKTKKVPAEWDVAYDEDELHSDFFVSPDHPDYEAADGVHPPSDLDPEDVTEWGEEFIQTEPMVFTGKAKKPDEFYIPPPPPGYGPESAKPSRFLQNLIPHELRQSQFKNERNEVYNSYGTGANRTPFTSPNGFIRANIPGFDESTPQKIIDDYYENTILPELKRIIFNTPVVRTDKVNDTSAWYLGSQKKIYHAPANKYFPWERNDPMSPNTFKHEIGHAIDHQLGDLLRFTPMQDYKWRMSQHQDKIMNKIFPHLPLRSKETFKDEPTYETHGHSGSRGEIYDSIIMTREKMGRMFNADDVKKMRKWYAVWKDDYKQALWERDSRDYDLIRAINKFADEMLTNQEIADLLNQVAKVDIPTKQINRGYA